MTNSEAGTVLITGANAGLGKEVARQLAERKRWGTIILACRNPQRGLAAKADLENRTSRARFEVKTLDTTDPASINALISDIERPVDAVVLNAGGVGPDPIAPTPHGVTTIFAANVLGHAALLEGLLAKQLLAETAVLVGSEAARGAPALRIGRPHFRSDPVAEFASVIDGSFFEGRAANPMLAYAQVKYLGTLWMSALARRHPELRLLTVSPGNTSGTEVLRDLPPLGRFLMRHTVMSYVGRAFKISHPLAVGAGRLTDAVDTDVLRSGGFYASPGAALTGPLCDQSEVYPEFGDTELQERAYAAIHQFI